jgi:outer membrane biosynthesis protein TonB
VRFLDPELEHQSMKAVQQWIFEPASLHGKPVAQLVEIELTFTLK